MRKIICIALIASLAGCFNKIVLTPFGASGDDMELREHVLYGRASTACFSGFSSRTKVLIVPVQGVIGADSMLSRGGTSVAGIKRTLEIAEQDPEIAALILLIDSPGGTVSASDQIHRLLIDFSAKTKKPIYAHVDGVGASGAYYIASSALEINASSASIVGSIGVILQSFSVQGLMQKIGIEYRSLKTGKNKDSLSPFRELREDEKDFFMKQLTQAYEIFLRRIMDGRKDRISEDKLRELADGSVYSATDAKQYGLIDSVSYIEDYLAEISKRMDLHDPLFVAYLPPGKSYSLYNVRSDRRASVMSLLEMPDHPTAAMYYLWDGGF